MAFDNTGDGGGIASIFDGLDLGDSVPLSDVEPPSFLDLLLGRDETQVQLVSDNPLDKFGEPYYQKGGHHEMPRSIYNKWDLPPETRTVFEKSTSGTLPKGVQVGPDGTPIGNFWNGKDGPHGRYNDAVGELSNKYIEKNNIDLKKMTPDQARGLLKEIRESEDPRIRDFNNGLRNLRRIFRLGPGRSE